MMEELKPCPFCGGEARIIGCSQCNEVFVKCSKCGIMTESKLSREQVVADWNCRTATKSHIAGAGKMVPSSSKAPTCGGCIYKVDFPSSVHCFGCARIYGDHYVRRPEDTP